jgi:hypothetical protein
MYPLMHCIVGLNYTKSHMSYKIYGLSGII